MVKAVRQVENLDQQLVAIDTKIQRLMFHYVRVARQMIEVTDATVKRFPVEAGSIFPDSHHERCDALHDFCSDFEGGFVTVEEWDRAMEAFAMEVRKRNSK